ncbi:MAG: helix-turn-helix domain-containing protein [Bacilli bacterium]|nr:helix-turn-helix domain-containing protein [Bacilli bacterium]
MTLKEVVGMNLKYYRYQTGLSQDKYYISLGLNPKYFASMERGLVNFTSSTIEELADKMGVNINDLILYNEKHKIQKKRIDEKLTVKN